MELSGLITALFLPWLLGISCLLIITSNRNEYNLLFLAGYGYFVGIITTTIFIRLWNTFGLSQVFWIQASVLFLLAFIFFLLSNRIRKATKNTIHIATTSSDKYSWVSVLWVFFMVLICIRFLTLAQEIVLRPLYPWDAWWHWIAKAHIWLEWNNIVPIVDPNTWLTTTNKYTYTLDGYYKPITASLISYWTASGLGVWNDVLINTPWLLCGIAFALAFYGQLKLWGVKPLSAIIFTYLLISLPYMNVHIALAGYVDLWIACLYALAAMSFLLWIRDGKWPQGILTIFMIFSLILMKLPGIVWALTFLPALLIAYAARKPVIILEFTFLVIAVFYVLYNTEFTYNLLLVGKITYSSDSITIGSTISTVLSYHDVSTAFYKTGFLSGNWHLLPILIVFSFLSAFTRKSTTAYQYAAITLMLGFVSIAFFLFFLTDWYIWAIDQTTINRFMLHAVPTLLFSGIVLLVGPVDKTRMGLTPE